MWYPNNNFEDTYNVHVLLLNKNSYIFVFFRKRGVTLVFHLPCDRIRVQNEEGRSCKNESCSFAQRDWEFTVYSKLFSECEKDITESRTVLVSCLPNSSQILTTVPSNPSESPCSCPGSAFFKDFRMEVFPSCPDPMRVFLGCWPTYTRWLWFIHGLPYGFF